MVRTLDTIRKENREFQREELEKKRKTIKTDTRELDQADYDSKEHTIEHVQVEATSYVKIQYRDIARMFVRALPLKKTTDIEEAVDSYLEQIRALPENQRLALKVAYVFARKVPKDEQEDFYQELALCLLKNGTKEEKLAYTITRCNWLDFWRDYKRKATHYGGSLDSFDLKEFEDTDFSDLDTRDKRTIREYITGFCEFEAIEAKLDAKRLYDQLPLWIKRIVDRRLAGDKIGNGDLICLNKWLASKPECLMDYVNAL